MLTLNPSYCGSETDVEPMERLSLEDGETKRYEETRPSTYIGREGEESTQIEEAASKREHDGRHDDGRPFGRDDEISNTRRDRIDGSSEDDLGEIYDEEGEDNRKITALGSGDDRSVGGDESMDATGQPDSLPAPVFVDTGATEQSRQTVGRTNDISEDRKSNDADSSNAVETFNAGRSFLLQNLDKTVHQLDSVVCKICKVCTSVCKCGEEIREILTEDDDQMDASIAIDCWRTRSGYIYSDLIPNLYESDERNPVRRGVLDDLMNRRKYDAYAQKRLDDMYHLNPDGSKCPLGCWCAAWHPPSSGEEREESQKDQTDVTTENVGEIDEEWSADNVVLSGEQLQYINSFPEEERQALRDVYLYEDWLEHDRQSYLKKTNEKDVCDSSLLSLSSSSKVNKSTLKFADRKRAKDEWEDDEDQLYYLSSKLMSTPKLQMPLEEDLFLHRKQYFSSEAIKQQEKRYSANIVDTYGGHPQKHVRVLYAHSKVVDDCRFHCPTCDWCDYYCLCTVVEDGRIDAVLLPHFESLRDQRIRSQQMTNYQIKEAEYFKLKKKYRSLKRKLETSKRNELSKKPVPQ